MPNFNCNCDDFAFEQTLAGLRTRILRRLGYSAQAANPPPGMAELIDDFLQSAQKQLYLRYPSLHTERFFSWTMIVGERYYGYGVNDEQNPANPEGQCTKVLNPLKLSWVGFEDLNNTWTELVEGIDPVLYTRANITPGWPAFYEMRQCIEIFPAPQEAYKLRVKGHFGLLPFVDDDDVVTIDDELIFLFALAAAKRHYGQSDANDYFGSATAHLGQLTKGAHGLKRYIPNDVQAAPLTPPLFLPLIDP